jgi:hypothetical protein
MSDNAILAAMRRMGIAKDEMSCHGFRAMARTILDEVLGFRPDFIAGFREGHYSYEFTYDLLPPLASRRIRFGPGLRGLRKTASKPPFVARGKLLSRATDRTSRDKLR